MSTISIAGVVAKHASFHWSLGDVPTWLGALATIGALIGAYAIWKVESGRDEFTAQERRDRAELEQRAQADRVAAWYGRSDDGSGGPQVIREWGAFIQNSSDLPVYDLSVSFRFLTPQANDPDRSAERSLSDLIRVVPPTDRIFVRLDHSVLEQTDRDSYGNYVVALDFRDAAGRLWRRDAKGGLAERAGAS